jgi:hypothetical protein
VELIMRLLDWLYRKVTEDLTEQRRIAVTEVPHPPTEPSRTLPDRRQELSERFTHHASTEKQIKAYGSLRTRAKEFSFLIDELCPASDEKEWALHYLDMVVMNANAAIARHTEEGS